MARSDGEKHFSQGTFKGESNACNLKVWDPMTSRNTFDNQVKFSVATILPTLSRKIVTDFRCMLLARAVWFSGSHFIAVLPILYSSR